MRNECSIHQQIIKVQETVFRVAGKRGWSIARISAETSIPAPTLTSYRNGAMMPLSAFVKLAAVLPTDLINLLVEDSGHHLTPLDAGAANWDIVAAEAADLVSNVCQARADGKIDHREAERLKEGARKLIANTQKVIN